MCTVWQNNKTFCQMLIKTLLDGICFVLLKEARLYTAAISQKQYTTKNLKFLPADWGFFGQTSLLQCDSEGFSQGRTWGHGWSPCRGKRFGHGFRFVPKTIQTNKQAKKPQHNKNNRIIFDKVLTKSAKD